MEKNNEEDKNKKATKAPSEYSDKKDTLENKDQKNSDKKAAGQNEIGKHEYDEFLTTEIRMKPQPLEKDKQPTPQDRESDGL